MLTLVLSSFFNQIGIVLFGPLAFLLVDTDRPP
jgi:hypothetical protein